MGKVPTLNLHMSSTPGQATFPTTNLRRPTMLLIITEFPKTNGGGECPNSIGLVPRRVQGKGMG